MNRRLGITLALILVAVLIGAGAYQAGVAHGVAQQIAAGPAAARDGVRGMGYGYYCPGFGFPLLGILFPLLLILLIFAAAKAAFSGPRYWGGPPPWVREGARGAFEEWHRDAHGERRDRQQGTDTSRGT